MPSASAAAFPVTLTDDEGTEVELAAEPTKIVSLTPATTEILFALGVGDRIVGKVEDFSLYPPEAAAIPDVAKFGEVDVEQIVSLEADLVIAGGNDFNPPDEIEQLRDARRPGPRRLRADIDDRVRRHRADRRRGRAPAEAKDLTASMRAGFDQVGAATSGTREAAGLLRARRDRARSTPRPTTRSSPR